jgi:hypothetical protein
MQHDKTLVFYGRINKYDFAGVGLPEKAQIYLRNGDCITMTLDRYDDGSWRLNTESLRFRE